MQLIRNAKDNNPENDTFTLHLDSLEMTQLIRCCCITKRHWTDVLGLLAAEIVLARPETVLPAKEQFGAFDTNHIFDTLPVVYAVAHETSSIEKVV